ncbi:allantoinase PuuE [Phreatobacter stygius]|uniref:Chitooligosaccharide deacetylase n=1 Tax=Phreatobacter stygius TaxID=1940610 RepID=A0A4D7BDL3_9HYPH|nr:allantoinase PuuE [Phreatobacter stygius]QCI66037.1 allantoinase PuuE [Phreatobacter stygius]
MQNTPYPRDMIGYGRTPPTANWPGGARIAVQFVINYEEGGENNVLHGDPASEAFLSEMIGAQPWPGQRHPSMESIYEYGSRAGFWRLWRLFTKRRLPVTVYGVATALERHPDAVAAMREADWEIASHGLKWIDHRDMPIAEERAAIAEALRIHTAVCGERPLGWYTGRTSENTLDLVMQDGGFLYSADSYADDLPYWVDGPKSPHLIVPYTLDANDMRFATAQGFNSGDQFLAYLKDSFDVLYAEGTDGAPKMLSIGLHCRLAGRPGRLASLARFLDHIQGHEKVWICRRVDIARHWAIHHYPAGGRPSGMTRPVLVAKFGDVFEHTPEIVARAHDAGLTSADDTAEGLHGALTAVLDAMTDGEKRALINAHPDLAGRLAAAGQLTADSANEQAGANLDRLTPDELARFTALNDAYRARHHFPFIMAVKGATKQAVLDAFERRMTNSAEDEFATAIAEIKRIALFRLKDRMRAA